MTGYTSIEGNFDCINSLAFGNSTALGRGNMVGGIGVGAGGVNFNNTLIHLYANNHVFANTNVSINNASSAIGILNTAYLKATTGQNADLVGLYLNTNFDNNGTSGSVNYDLIAERGNNILNKSSGNTVIGTGANNAVDKLQIYGSLIANQLKSAAPGTGASSDYLMLYETASKELKQSSVQLSGLINNSGTVSQSGNGVLKDFVVTHGLSYTPSCVSLTPNSADAAMAHYISAISSTTFIITFIVAPALGVNNIKLFYIAKP